MSANDTYLVYCHTCKANGKKYIGVTKNIAVRWGKDGRAYFKHRDVPDTAFARAILKYGWDGFDHIVLRDGLQRSQAMEMEQYYIALYKTNICRYGTDFGYNMTDGGDGGLGGHHRPTRECTLAGNAAVRRYVTCVDTGDVFTSITSASDEMCISQTLLSACCRGRRQTGGGLRWRYSTDDDIARYERCGNSHISDDDRRKIISAARSKREQELLKDKREHSRKMVQCLETGVVFKSATDAASAVGTDCKNISACCTGRSKTCCGYHWSFVESR